MFLSITLELTAVLFKFNNIPFSITKNADIKETIKYYYAKINNK